MNTVAKPSNLLSSFQKLSCGLSLVSFSFVDFSNKMTCEPRYIMLLCPLNLFKLVCTRAIPNNSRVLLHSKLMQIRFWKREKKSNSILISLCEQTQPLHVEKKVSNLNACLFLQSKKNKNSFFLTVGRKKSVLTLIFLFFKKD